MEMNGFNESRHGAHRKMVELVGKGKAVLELGCGEGFVSERLQRNQCVVTAVELDKRKAERAKGHCKEIIVGDVETAKLGFKQNSFDAILFGDVLEHLLQPAEVLRKMGQFLKKDGRVIVSIPNIANWKIRLQLLFGGFDYREQGILDKTHLHFFTRKTARQLIEGAGYKIVEEDFVPSFPFPFFKPLLAKINPNAFAFQFIFAAKKK